MGCGGVARPDSRYEPSPLLHVLGQILGVDADGIIKITKENNQSHISRLIYPIGRRKPCVYFLGHDGGWIKLTKGHRNRKQGNREYNHYDPRLIDLKRKIC